MPLRPSYANVASTAALFVALGGTAIASSAGSGDAPATHAQATNTINACTAKKGSKKGLLRVAKVCKKSETKVSWSVVGPQGSQGPQGAQGPQGSSGASGADGASGTSAFVPAGSVMHFDLAACPAGWAPYTEAEGRYLVGTQTGGANGTSVGTALTVGENRAIGRHGHTIVDPGHTHNAIAGNTIVAGNVPFVRFQSNGSGAAGSQGTLTTVSATTGVTVAAAGGINGTNAPYVNLLVCKKG